ncbi:MAG: diguanylate cyclase [Pseudomonadales bacterium]|jgi:diguanylate cyclase (GGDEF)-like protein|nr:diguanylate cyclase [Pseudomonadales bacterium]
MLSHFTYIRALNLLLGVSLAATSFVLSYKHERQQIFQEFTSQVDAFASSLELELGRNIAVLNSFRSFHEAFPQVEQKGFSTFSRNAREYNDGVYGMKWVPRVLNENRAAFEAELKAKFGIPGITDVAESQEGSGHYSLSPVSDEYYPILMSDPEASKELPIGYDLASKIVTRTALETATSNDQAIASTPLTVMEEGKQKYIYFISLPLYDKSAESEEERWKELKGFIVGLYDIDTIFNGVLENAWNWSEANNIALDDNSGQVSGTSIRVSEHTGSDLVDDDRFVYSKQLSPIADLQWFLVGTPSKSYFSSHRTLFPYMLGVGILLFSLMIEAYLRVLRRMDNELQDAALMDGLTRIPNRRRFFEMVHKEWPRAQRFFRPLTIILCDVDNFKKYNDVYGHVRGDRCLHDVAQALHKSVHRPGDMAARYGGEEFAIILPETTLEAAREVAEKCRQAVQDLGIEHAANANFGVVTISIGVACVVPEDALHYGDLIEMADQALYESKERGRNCVSLYRTKSSSR